MAAAEKILPVPWFKQQKLYYCGPAVAQMFLGFFKVSVSQDDLWTDITNNSGGSRPPDAPASDHAFPQQVCDNCGVVGNGIFWNCWDTTPEALQKTVADRTKSVSLGARYTGTFEAGVEDLIESLDRTPESPVFATLHAFNHWIIVHGYLRDDTTATEALAKQVGKYTLNGLYVLDPFDAESEAHIRLVSIEDWSSQFGLIPCGPRVDTHPVVVRETSSISRAMMLAVLVTVVIIAAIWWLGSD